MITKRVILPIARALARYMQSFCIYYSLANIEERSKKHTFYEWINMYCDCNEICQETNRYDNENFIPIPKEDLISSLEYISTRCEEVLNNEAWYIKENIMGIE